MAGQFLCFFLQIIMVDKSGLMAGASDPRKRGTADGY